MRLKENNQISSFRLARSAVDAAFLPRLLKMIHDRWRIPWAAAVFRATKPLIIILMNWFVILF